MWWLLKVNRALTSLGIDQNILKLEYVDAALILEKRGSLTPEETALWVISYLPLEYQSNVDYMLTIWREQDKISYLKDDVCQAMSRLGYAVFPETSPREGGEGFGVIPATGAAFAPISKPEAKGVQGHHGGTRATRSGSRE